MAGLLAGSPLTGHEIQSRIGGDAFQLWRACFSGPEFDQRVVGRRYVRLDRQVDGYARISPSILREFLTYTVIGIAGDPAIEVRARAVQDHITTVSRTKLALSRQIARSLGAEFARTGAEEDRYCVVVAGDIVYGMAHDVYRPERSTGSMVHGSDLDLVVIVEDDDAAGLAPLLDEAIYGRKYQYLKHPAYNEEIDYVVKPFAKLVEQAAFDNFPHMVACKIYEESELLYGSESLFLRGKDVLRERGVVDRLRTMEDGAIRARDERVQLLLAADEMPGGDQRFHFYNDDEAPEFE
ncbi:MAG: hypothetical protein ACQERF_02690 [Actinomycetota bacterium]